MYKHTESEKEDLICCEQTRAFALVFFQVVVYVKMNLNADKDKDVALDKG